MIAKFVTNAPRVMPRDFVEASLRPPSSLEGGLDSFAGLLQQLGSKETALTPAVESESQEAQNSAEPIVNDLKGRLGSKVTKCTQPDDAGGLGLIWNAQAQPRAELPENCDGDRPIETMAAVTSERGAETIVARAHKGPALEQPNFHAEFVTHPPLKDTPKSWLEPELLIGQAHRQGLAQPDFTLHEFEPRQGEQELSHLVSADLGSQDLDELARPMSGSLTTSQGLEGQGTRKRRLGRVEGADLGASQASQIQDSFTMPEVFGTSRPQPHLLWGGGRAATFLQVLVLTIQDRASVFVKLPAVWDMARNQIRDLVAGRASSHGVPLERIEVAEMGPASGQKLNKLEEYRP
ncbi:hypothetical protein [Aquidulcibacter sp.]|uniref:hypothetical protein n=1 Tax=Aquidulcibacter sp. TaxID=2052990 RepID=UPI0037BF9B57